MSSRSRTIQVRIDYSGLSDLSRVGDVRSSVDRVLGNLGIRIDHELAALISREPVLSGIAVSSIHDLGGWR